MLFVIHTDMLDTFHDLNRTSGWIQLLQIFHCKLQKLKILTSIGAKTYANLLRTTKKILLPLDFLTNRTVNYLNLISTNRTKNIKTSNCLKWIFIHDQKNRTSETFSSWSGVGGWWFFTALAFFFLRTARNCVSADKET